MRFFGFRTFFIVFLLSVCVSAYAQTGSVRVRMEDAGTGEAVGYATVSLNIPVVTVTQREEAEDEGRKSDRKSDEPDTTIVLKPYRYVLSTGEGVAEITGVRAGTYVLKVEMVGYKDLEQSVEVGSGVVDLGVLKMEEDVEVLEAASIVEQGYPVMVKKDTLEFSTAFYRTEEQDMLEDLLKKLPGVEVDDDGNVTSNGEPITKITINGKSFFLDDPTMATKNLSAKIIDKIKVVEKKTDDAIFLGIDDGVRETVIDLTIKPGMLEDWSGNVSGGIAHEIPPSNDPSFGSGDWLFKGSAQLKRFTDLSQLTILGNGNNTNNGTTTSWGAGINGAYNLFDGDMDLAAHYNYRGSHVQTESQRDKTTYLDDGTNLLYSSEGKNERTTQTHSIGVKLEHKFSENTQLRFEPKFNLSETEGHNYSTQTTLTDPCTGEDPVWTNSGFTESMSLSQSWSTNGSLLLRQRLGVPGRTVSVGLSYSVSGSKSESYTQSLTETLPDEAEDVEGGELAQEFVNRRVTASSHSFSINPHLTYIEPLVENKLLLQVSFGYAFSLSSSHRTTYDSADNNVSTDDDGNMHLTYTREGEVANGSYSYSADQIQSQFHTTASFRYQGEKLKVQLGVAFRLLEKDVENYGENFYDKTSTHWYPVGMFSYDFSDHTNMRLTYSGNWTSPSLGQLIPMVNNSNPLSVGFTNPYLETGFTHSLRGTFSYTNKETFTSLRVNWAGNLIEDRIATSSWYDSDGAYYSMPLNGPLGGNTSLAITFNTPLHGSSLSLINQTNFGYSNTMAYSGISEGDRGDYLISKYYNAETGVMDYESFNNDFFGSDHTLSFSDYFNDAKTETLSFTERLRFKYDCDLVLLYLGGRTTMSKSWRSISSNNVSANWRNMVDFTTEWHLPAKVGIGLYGTYNWYDGFTTRRDDEFIFTASVWKHLFDSRFTMVLAAYDIFNQRQSFSVTDASDYHLESRTNVFGRYLLLTMTYRFGENNKK